MLGFMSWAALPSQLPAPTYLLLQSCRMAHLDRPYGDWPQAVTSIPGVCACGWGVELEEGRSNR